MNNQALVDELMPGLAGRDLETGELRYAQAMTVLRENNEAYALFEESEKAIQDKDFDIALASATSLPDRSPAEAAIFT